MRSAALAGLFVLLAGCGRTGVGRPDAAAREVGGSDIVDARDGASEPAPQPDAGEVAADRGSDLPGPDGPVDTPVADVGLDAVAPPDLGPRGCPPLANDGVLNLGHIKQALFAADGNSLLVRMGAWDDDTDDDARLIQLPSGQSRVLGSGVRNVAWLGPSRALLTTRDNTLVAVALDGSAEHTSAGPTCTHAATPDGARVYFTATTCDHSAGPLRVLDVATGTVTKLAESASTSSLAVSPDSRFAAYVVPGAAIGTGTVHLVDAAGTVTQIRDPSSAFRPAFAAGPTLVFQAQDAASSEPTLWRYDLDLHVAQVLTPGDPGIAGYEIAPDGSALLAARLGNVSAGRGGELYLVPLDGRGPERIATDVMDYRIFSMVVRAFAFAPAIHRILYIADRANDGGRATGISSIGRDGGPVQLSANGMGAVLSSYADRVALSTVDRTLGRSTISVMSTVGASQFSVDIAGEMSFAGFVPRDRGLLFLQTVVDPVLGSVSDLRHLSFTSGKMTRLGTWTKSPLALDNYPVGISAHEYPVDPFGCYTVVASDLDQTASRLTALPDE